MITNEESSTMARLADYKIFTKAGKELAVASTKTYCTQVFVFAYIAQLIVDKRFSLDIKDFVNQLTKFIGKINIKSLVNKLKDKDKLILIGRDIDYALLLEASLKIREIDYIYTIPMYSGELKHGTLSLIDNDSVILSLNTSNDISKLDVVKNEIESRGGEVVEIDKLVDLTHIQKYLKPIFAIIPFQLLSYNIALEKGYNPDMPRNLAKSVTVE